MKTADKWSLKSMYDGFSSDKYKEDMVLYVNLINRMTEYAKTRFADTDGAAAKVEGYLELSAKTTGLADMLISYAHLSLSADVNNTTAAKELDVLEERSAALASPEALFSDFIKRIGEDGLEGIIEKSPLLKEHAFILRETLQKARYTLSEYEERTIAVMETNGSSAWEKLRDSLTATLEIEIEKDGKKTYEPLSVIRNYAYSKDASLRKRAYEAELAAYPRVEKSVAAALNAIKGEVLSVSEMRGYDSPLHMTLVSSRMDGQTLDSLIGAVERSLPLLRRFLRNKAKALNADALPFYDLFAPLGKTDEYTFVQAADMIKACFDKFSGRLGALAARAFSEGWIDVYPREGKTGGAFCAFVHPIFESRILLNFGGTYSDITTLAHELGHAYHNECMRGMSILNASYTMPIAETASIFCETLVTKAMLAHANADTRLMAADEALTGAAQVIVDIYSRYLFETRVFEARKNGPLDPSELNGLMTAAQKEAYGDALDANAMHPYAWIPKSHYYYAHHNFYNFPYAYGYLFSRGLFARYEQEGASFAPKYEALLAATGSSSLREIGNAAGVDVSDAAFWDAAFDTLKSDVDAFCAELT